MSMFSKKAFTLIELLVVVLIVGVLAAVAVPQYQRAVLKSRFTALMPIGKTLANANEAYYLQHLEYASAPADLPVEGQSDYPDGTSIELVNDEKFSYTLVYNEDKLPDNNYVVYQKHSANFPGNTHCEARTGETQAEQVCTALGGTLIGENGNFTAYLLSGDAESGNFDKECKGQKESTEEECECGSSTRDVSCDTKTGQWSYGSWSGCTDKPETSQSCSANGKTGTQTRSVTCGDSGWETGNWSMCDIPCTGTQPASWTSENGSTGTASCIEGEWVRTWTDGGTYTNGQECKGGGGVRCVGATFESGSSCFGGSVAYVPGTGWFGACEGSTFKAGSFCSEYNSSGKGCQNVTYEPGSWCQPFSNNTGECAAGSPAGVDGVPFEGECWDGNGNHSAEYCSQE